MTLLYKSVSEFRIEFFCFDSNTLWVYLIAWLNLYLTKAVFSRSSLIIYFYYVINPILLIIIITITITITTTIINCK